MKKFKCSWKLELKVHILYKKFTGLQLFFKIYNNFDITLKTFDQNLNNFLLLIFGKFTIAFTQPIISVLVLR